MSMDSEYWMNYSVAISRKRCTPGMCVGAVLVSDQNQLLCYAYEEEEVNKTWYNVMIPKINKLGKSWNTCDIYLTVNTLSSISSFHLESLLHKINIKNIYLGLPDPLLTTYLTNDPVITFDKIYRYADELQIKILNLNKDFYKTSAQNISNNYYYSNNRISTLVIELLKQDGFIINSNELKIKGSSDELVSLLCSKYHIDNLKAVKIVNNVISEAFNIKYGNYDYLNDVRSLNSVWIKNFRSYYKTISKKTLSCLEILNIGIGSGNEASYLFSNCKNITFVDIVTDGLRKIKENFPNAITINNNAENLSSIADDSYELYISLRTFNSSFFNIKRALSEATRVLKNNSLIIISIANGFLCSNSNSIIPGLIIPTTNFVDIYRSFNIIKLIQAEFNQLGFGSIEIFSTDTEIYISAITNKDKVK